MAEGEFCMEQYYQSLLQKAAVYVEELRRTNTTSLVVKKWVVAPRTAPRLGALNEGSTKQLFPE